LSWLKAIHRRCGSQAIVTKRDCRLCSQRAGDLRNNVREVQSHQGQKPVDVCEKGNVRCLYKASCDGYRERSYLRSRGSSGETLGETLGMAKSNGSSFVGLLLLGVLGILAWLSWPVSLWVLAVLIVHWCLRSMTERLRQARLAGKSGLLRALLEISGGTLSRSVIYVGAGITLVAVAQAALWLGAQWIEPSQVRQVEQLLSWSYQRLLAILDLEALAIALGVLLAVTLLRPRSEYMGHFLKLRSALSRVAFMLLGVTSFTFFGALDMQLIDPEWRRAELYAARAKLREISDETRDMASAAWIEAEVRRLDADKQKDLANFFQSARTSSFAPQIVRAAAVELAGKAPKVTAAAEVELRVDGVIPERMRTYIRGEGLAPHSVPTLAELRVANERLTAHELRLRAARTAVIELASEAIASLGPKIERPLVNAFVQELTSTLARGALREVVPASVADVTTAKEWVRTHFYVAQPVERAYVPHAWQFSMNSLERGAVSGGVRTSEVLMAALVARLHGQAQAAQAMRTYRPPMPSGGTIHSTGSYRPSTRIRVRW